MKRTTSLYWRFARIILGSMLALLIGYWAFVLRPMGLVLAEVYQKELVREADLALALWAQPLSKGAAAKRRHERLQSAFEQADHLAVWVFKQDGTVVFQLHHPYRFPHDPQRQTQRLLRLAKQGERIHSLSRKSFLKIVRKIPGNQDEWLLLSPVHSGRGLITRRFPRLGLRTLSLLAAVAALGALFAARLLTGRLRTLDEGMQKLAAGDTKIRLEPGTADELGRLIESFNQTAATLAKAREDLLAQGQARKELLADVSHELRTPLTSLLGHIELLSEESDTLRPDQTESLGILSEEANNLKQRIDDLLLLARSDLDQLPLRKKDLEIRSFLETLTGSFRPLAEARNLEVRFAPKTRSDSKAERVYADPDRLGQVLRNLMQNALNAGQPGGFIQLKVYSDGDTTTIEVHDTGRGLEASELSKIFERFQQGKGSQGAGTGLGLAIAKRLVEAHGGTLKATSELGVGSCFSVTLPSTSSPQDLP